MIVSFSVSNFRSFASEETFFLVASKRLSASHEQHAVPIPDSEEKVLRTGVLYGANGAGKSNLFKALRFLRSVALEPGKNRGGTDRVCRSLCSPCVTGGKIGGVTPASFAAATLPARSPTVRLICPRAIRMKLLV